jgi:Cof subfamily protein (haloacid dehalogenase superfamily)
MIRLVGIDVDGTLVGTGGVVNPIVWTAAQRARDAGIHLVLCSGRPAFALALEYARRLDDRGWHIFQNGASVIHLASNASRSTPLSDEPVRALIEQARASNRVLELYGDREYAVESTTPFAVDHARLLGVPFQARSFESLPPPIVRAQWVVLSAEAQQIAAQPDPQLEVAISTSPVMPDAAFVGLTHRGVNKGAALRTLATEYGVELNDIMYVGDSDNDLSALRVAGMPVAMGNADENVRRIATRIVAHVDEGGVAEALEFAIRTRS